VNRELAMSAAAVPAAHPAIRERDFSSPSSPNRVPTAASSCSSRRASTGSRRLPKASSAATVAASLASRRREPILPA
jgi:hypothetical protein